MSFVKAFNNLSITRSYVSMRALNPKKFTSILEGVPSRPRNPWQIYVRENVKNFKNEQGKSDLKVATKELSAKWKTLSATEKQPYEAKFNKETEEHLTKMAEALKNATPEQFQQENALRRKYNLPTIKDPKQPKRPENAFFIYLKHLRATNDPIITDNEPRTQVSLAAKKYKELSPEESAVFVEKEGVARAKYAKEMEAYNNSEF